MEKKKIPNQFPTSTEQGKLTDIERKIHGFDSDRNAQLSHVSLKYFQTNYECFSAWTPSELKDFSSFITRMNQSSWNDIHKGGGSSGNKTGFGMTKHLDKKKLPGNAKALDNISEDITLFELRVNQKARVHGFRSVSVFFLVWLDREHRVYKM